jgi:chaperone LolA
LKNKLSILNIIVLSVVALFISVGGAAAQSRPTSNVTRPTDSGPSPFEGIKKTYSAIVTMEARFHQTIFIASLKKERESDGEFLYKRQKGFVWRYKTPKVKLFLYDGKHIWQAEDDKAVVIKEKIRKEKTGGTFLDLIEDIAKMDELFTLKQQTRSGDLDVLELVPKKEGTINSARIWIDKQNRVKKLEINEFTGNTNTIEFSSIRINQAIDDSRFIFKPDKGKEIMER